MKKLAVFLILPLLIISCKSITVKQELPMKVPEIREIWDFNDPAGTEAEFKKLLSTVKDSGDTDYYLQIQTQIARAQGLQGKFKEAHRTLDQVEKDLKDEYITARLRYLLERGRVFNSSGNPEKSRPLFTQAWDLSREQGKDSFAVDAAHMLAIVNPPENQLAWNLKALDVVENSKDESLKGWLGPLYNNIGWTYHDNGRFEKALEYFKKGLDYRQEIKDDQGTRIARWTIGRCYRSLNRIDEAIKIQQDLEQEFMNENLPQDGYVYEELAECYLIKGETETARKYFKLAYDILSNDPWLKKNEPDRLERLEKLSR